MKYRQQQYTLTAGELDPLLIGRSDLEQYFSGAETMKNVLPLPQGGFQRGPGLEYISTLYKQISRITSGVTPSAPNGGTAANANDDDGATELTTTTGISTTDPYVVVKYDLGSAKTVLFADVVNFYLDTGSVADEFYIQYSTDDSTWTSLGDPVPAISTSGSNRSRRVTGPITARYWRFARIGSTDLTTAVAAIAEFSLWTEGSSLSESRMAYFNFSASQRYLLVFTDRNVAVYKSGTLQANVRGAHSSAQLSLIDWVHKQDSLIVVHEDVTPQLLQRQGADDEWQMDDITFDNTPFYRYTETTSNPATTLTPSAVDGSITLTAGTAAFSTADVGQYVDGNGGLARIVAYTSTTVVKAVVEVPFYDTNAIASGDWTVLSGYEAAWSATRGYPKTVTFYDSRLWFGGSKNLPSNIWGSRINAPFDFDLGQNLDDEAIAIQIEAEEVPVIVALYPGRNLQIFTTTQERWVPQATNEAITPNNVITKKGTARGSKAGIRPQSVSGTTMFLQAEGKAVRDFVFVDTEQDYQAASISAFSSHLLKNPRDMVLRKATSTTEADLLVLCNDDDGTLAILSRLRDQDVGGWVPRETPGASGKFLQCGIEGSDIYFAVERTINGSTVRYLEKFRDQDECLLDSAKIGTVASSTTTITGLDHLEGETVKVIGDDFLQADKTVASGSITLATAITSSYQIGLNFTPEVKPMPIAQQLQDGTIVGKQKRVIECAMILKDTVNVTVNGINVPFQTFGTGASSPLDTAITPYTGRKVVEGILGWSDEGQVTISQSIPARLTLQTIELKVQL